MIEEQGIKITMPFYGKNESNEVQIESSEIIYSEINSCGYGLQLNNEDNREEVKTLCFEISDKIKELDKLLKIDK